MGRITRFVCTSVPFALTFASLVALIVVITGGVTDKSYYFFKADTSNLTISSSLITRSSPIELPSLNTRNDDLTPTLTEKSIAGELASAAGADSTGASFSASSLGLADYYTVSLWNYCAVTNSSSGTNTTCSSPKAEYWFDPLEVWGISNDTALENLFPSEVKSALKTYRRVSKWTFIVYMIALAATILELVMAGLTMFFAVNGCINWIVSTICSVSVTGASVLATAMSSVVVGSLDSYLKSYGIEASLGRSMLVATWLAVAFKIAASLYMFLANCCCGRCMQTDGPRSRRNRGGNDAEKMLPTRGYEPIGAVPYGQQPTVYNPPTAAGYSQPQEYGRTTDYPMQPVHMSGAQTKDVGAGYEPYRHEHI